MLEKVPFGYEKDGLRAEIIAVKPNHYLINFYSLKKGKLPSKDLNSNYELKGHLTAQNRIDAEIQVFHQLEGCGCNHE